MSALRIVPWVVHEAIEYVVGLFFVLSPFIFGFTDESALPVFLIVGVIFLALAVLSPGPAGILGAIPAPLHAAIDYLLAFFLLVAPFIFAFTDLDEALMISIFVGAAHLVITLLTAFANGGRETQEA